MVNQTPLIGSFFFRKTDNGNLIGEFSNNQSDVISTESADRTDWADFKDFDGVFNTTWQQNGVTFFGVLTIGLRVRNPQNIYTLNWAISSPNISFIGEGFLVDDMLIGHYRRDN